MKSITDGIQNEGASSFDIKIANWWDKNYQLEIKEPYVGCCYVVGKHNDRVGFFKFFPPPETD